LTLLCFDPASPPGFGLCLSRCIGSALIWKISNYLPSSSHPRPHLDSARVDPKVLCFSQPQLVRTSKPRAPLTARFYQISPIWMTSTSKYLIDHYEIPQYARCDREPKLVLADGARGCSPAAKRPIFFCPARATVLSQSGVRAVQEQGEAAGFRCACGMC
jgi:hypothetical protein